MHIYPNWNDHVSCPCKGKDEPKFYIRSIIKTQTNLVLLLFLGRLGRQRIAENVALLLKYPTFEVAFHTFVCQSICIFFKVLGIYNFEMSSRPLAANEACQYHI